MCSKKKDVMTNTSEKMNRQLVTLRHAAGTLLPQECPCTRPDQVQSIAGEQVCTGAGAKDKHGRERDMARI